MQDHISVHIRRYFGIYPCKLLIYANIINKPPNYYSFLKMPRNACPCRCVMIKYFISGRRGAFKTMIRNTTKNQKACWVIFILYLIGLTYFTFFAEALGRGTPLDGDAVARFNLLPFREIRRFIVYRHKLGMAAVLLNLVGNVVAFMPCGFLLPAISRRSRRFGGAVFVGFFISFLIECTQLLLRVGSFDVDDMILNTLGVALGFLLNRMVQKVRIRKKQERERRKVHIRRISPEGEASPEDPE